MVTLKSPNFCWMQAPNLMLKISLRTHSCMWLSDMVIRSSWWESLICLTRIQSIWMEKVKELLIFSMRKRNALLSPWQFFVKTLKLLRHSIRRGGQIGSLRIQITSMSSISPRGSTSSQFKNSSSNFSKSYFPPKTPSSLHKLNLAENPKSKNKCLRKSKTLQIRPLSSTKT